VDANVAIKWVLPEIHSNLALRLRNRAYQLLVPDFFFPEIGNIFWKRVRKGEMTLQEATRDLTVMQGLPLTIEQSFPLMSDALFTATRVDQAVYDCVYLALAVKHNCQMVTADERFDNAVKGDRLSVYLCWITNLP
jgi:predicted nucleic acid-binding protein